MRNNDKPVALIIFGYSFGDEHLNEVIVESALSYLLCTLVDAPFNYTVVSGYRVNYPHIADSNILAE